MPTLHALWRCLGQPALPMEVATPDDFLAAAAAAFDLGRIPRAPAPESAAVHNMDAITRV